MSYQVPEGVTRRTFLAGAGALGAATAVAAMSGSKIAFADEAATGTYTAGTYTATATGIGTVTVTVTFDETSITEVVLDVSNETATIGQAAADTLIEQVLEAQSADIEGVSGATLTSTAVATGVADCIEQASAGAATEEEETEEEATEEEAAAEEESAEEETTVEVTEGRVDYYASQVDWLGEAPVIDESEIVDTQDFDVVVVGSGYAGTQAALAACEGGLNVAVVESQEEESYAKNGSEIGHFNSSYVQDTWGVPEAEVGEVVDEFIKCNGGQVNTKIIRKYVENSGEMVDHLMEIISEDEEYSHIMEDGSLYVHINLNEDGSLNYTDYPIVESGHRTWAYCLCFKVPEEEDQGDMSDSGLGILVPVINKIQELGGTYFWGHTGYVLEQDDDGSVTGVICQNSDGEYVRLNASKGVCVTTGDFSGDGTMVASLLPETVEWNLRTGKTWDECLTSITGMSGRDGHGHKMCCWAGGLIEPTPRAVMSAGPSVSGPFGASCMLELNADGERFMNEADYYSARGVTARQPLGIVSLVTDTQYLKSIARSGIHHGGPDYSRESWVTSFLETMDEAAAEPGEHQVSVAGTYSNTVYSAETLEELAGYLGYEGDAVDTFVASVEHYNELCEAGVDSDFGKDADCMIAVNEPPYFGCVGNNGGLTGIGLVTLSGLVTDENFNVLDVDGNPISGLYVAGNTLGGRYATMYPTPVAGNSIGMALTHGRLLGQHLCEL